MNTSFFHVMVQGINKEYIFAKEKYILVYLDFLDSYRKIYHVDLIAYCIMHSHAHLLFHSHNTLVMSKLMHAINTAYAKYYNKVQNRSGYVFKDRFLSEPIISQRHLIKCIHYIHQNPVKAKIVEKCEDYPFSSYSNYVDNGGFSPTPILYDFIPSNTNFLESTSPKNIELFMDVDIDKEEILYHRIEDFIENTHTSLPFILKDKALLKKLVHYLKDSNHIYYSDISKVLNISQSTIRRIMNG